MEEFYNNLKLKLQSLREKFGPLTLSEKILLSHSNLDSKENLVYAEFTPDRIAMQDASAQMALLQFNLVNQQSVIPVSIHCDHLISAKEGSEKDLQRATEQNKEVYDFLKSASEKFGFDFWEPGAGIIHQVVLENYAMPGQLILGTDSHTPNAGGLCTLAIGVGGADVVDPMLGMPWELKWPKLIGVKLTGELSGWCSPKDVILYLAEKLTVKGGTGHIIEYFGDGCSTISCTGKATICNMGAEVGATTSIFPYDEKMKQFLKLTNRTVPDIELTADKEVLDNPSEYYDEVIELDLSSLEPRINGPFTPDKSWKLSELKESEFPDKINYSLIGSCTNSSYEDISKCADIAKQALSQGKKAIVPFVISPGSSKIKKTVERDGFLDILQEFGGTVMANACGPCIGMWDRTDVAKDEKNVIVTSFNRNFAKRNDGNPNTLCFVTSPEVATAFAINGNLKQNPFDGLLAPSGKELPDNFENASGLIKNEPDMNKQLLIPSDSSRLQLLSKFDKYDESNFKNLALLIKVKGKCTTDHISMAGKWLNLRGHLDNISDNTLMGAINYENDQPGIVRNVFINEFDNVAKVARYYKKNNVGWVIVAEENYGEGSSRELAAMQPRHLGCRVVIAKSFARIHETNLKKQGILALTFANKEDYDKINIHDVFSFDLSDFLIGKSIELTLNSKDKILLNHSYNENQISWFFAGSAINKVTE